MNLAPPPQLELINQCNPAREAGLKAEQPIISRSDPTSLMCLKQHIERGDRQQQPEKLRSCSEALEKSVAVEPESDFTFMDKTSIRTSWRLFVSSKLSVCLYVIKVTEAS